MRINIIALWHSVLYSRSEDPKFDPKFADLLSENKHKLLSFLLEIYLPASRADITFNPTHFENIALG